MLRIQDNLEVNLQNNNNIKKQKSNLGFTGHTVTEDNKGRKVYRFFLPKLNLGDENLDPSKKKKIELEIVRLDKDKDGNYKPAKANTFPGYKDRQIIDRKQGYIDIYQSDLDLNNKNNPDVAVGYKFIIDGDDFLDSSLLTSDRKWNIAITPDRALLAEPKSMYHIIPDLMISKEKEKADSKIYDVRRDHFNVLGGDFEGIIDRLDYMKDMGVKRILSTPFNENKSSHRYWTNNPYKIDPKLGGAVKFKETNIELFKRGMGWINDGAFVNEGLEGIHLAHVIKYGQKSPFANWFSTFDYPEIQMKFGIFSKKEDINKNYLGIKLVNAPYKIVVDDSGKQEVSENTAFNEKQPTYVQVYDNRRVQKETINNDEIIAKYDKNPEDPNKINNYMDSVIPYQFEINPDEVKSKYKQWKKDGKDEFRNHLASWSNFAATPSSDASGSVLWVGNKDINKLRFMYTSSEASERTPEELKKLDIATNQVQDSIVQIGEFWTDEITKTLETHAAQQLKTIDTTKNDAKARAAEYLALLKSDELPPEVTKITSKQIENVLEGNYSLKTIKNVPENVTEGLMAFNFDAVEFNNSLGAVLGSPHLKKLAANKDQIGKSRYEIYKTEQLNNYNNVPAEFRKNYKKMDELISGEMKEVAIKILKQVDETREKNKILDGSSGRLTEDGKQLYGLVSNDVARFVITQALLMQAAKCDPKSFDAKSLAPDYSNEDNSSTGTEKSNKFCPLSYKTETLNKVCPQSLDIAANKPEDEAEQLLSRIKLGLNDIKEEDITEFAKSISKRLEGIDGEKVKVAKLIVDKTESGLDWRVDAAKDVCPVENINEGGGKADFEESWDKGTVFWKNFIDGIRNKNPRSYVILEVTDEGQLVKANAAGNRNKYNDSMEACHKFIQGSGATTPTNYNFFYSLGHELYGSNTESNSHKDIGAVIQNLTCAWGADNQPWSSQGHLYANSLDSALQSHNSPGNHDKPRPLHLFGLDAKIFYEEGKEKAMRKALIDSFEKAFEKNKYITGDAKNGIFAAIDRLSKGEYHFENKAGSVEKRSFEADYFGVRPFDINIKDVLKEAKIESKAANDYLSQGDNQQQLENKTLKNMLEPALKKYRATMGLLVAVPGNPTVYVGDELGETGFEYKYKNTYVQNRNPVHFNRINENSPEYIEEVKDSQEKIQEVMNLRKNKRYSPLVNGSTVALPVQKAADNKTDVAVIYRYNDEKDMFILLNNKGFKADRENAGMKDDEKLSIDYIDLSKELTNLEKDPQSHNGGLKNVEGKGILSKLQEGAIYKNALKLKNGEEDPTEYKIDNQKLVRTDGNPIEIKGSDLFLYRVKNFNGLENKSMPFSGNSIKTNPHVKIAGMKYSLSPR